MQVLFFSNQLNEVERKFGVGRQSLIVVRSFYFASTRLTI
jgi:hypothetical protein